MTTIRESHRDYVRPASREEAAKFVPYKWKWYECGYNLTVKNGLLVSCVPYGFDGSCTLDTLGELFDGLR